MCIVLNAHKHVHTDLYTHPHTGFSPETEMGLYRKQARALPFGHPSISHGTGALCPLNWNLSDPLLGRTDEERLS